MFNRKDVVEGVVLKLPEYKSTSGKQLQLTMTNGDRIFESYGIRIALIRPNGDVYIDEKEFFHKKRSIGTTGRYRNYFLGEHIYVTRVAVKTGRYKLTNLNEE